ncbi:disks large [Anaeramoeba ignava]|uniref:Disks large n=1 Tax=Anaeramoeba ignava TaxID=1746090 RepID=A0A9Q0R732_ANAIG|nr:disks large [Anaeramoeba ignava]
MTNLNSLDKKTKLNLLRSEYKKLAKIFKEYQEKQKTDLQTIQSIKEENQHLSNLIEEKTEFISKQKNILSEKKLKLEKIQQKTEETKKELEEFSEKHDKLKKELENFNIKTQNLKILEQDRDSLKEQQEEMMKELETKEAEKLRLMEEIEKIQKELDDSNLKIADIDKKIKTTVELRTEAQKKEDKKVRDIFKLPSTEFFYNSYFCWKALSNGTLYLTTSYIGFKPRLLKKPFAFPIRDIVQIEKKKNVTNIDNSIEITRKSKKETIFFASFLVGKRDRCVTDIISQAKKLDHEIIVKEIK